MSDDLNLLRNTYVSPAKIPWWNWLLVPVGLVILFVVCVGLFIRYVCSSKK